MHHATSSEEAVTNSNAPPPPLLVVLAVSRSPSPFTFPRPRPSIPYAVGWRSAVTEQLDGAVDRIPAVLACAGLDQLVCKVNLAKLAHAKHSHGLQITPVDLAAEERALDGLALGRECGEGILLFALGVFQRHGKGHVDGLAQLARACPRTEHFTCRARQPQVL